MPLNATLLADGSSDQALRTILEWLLQQHLPQGEPFEVVVADMRGLPRPPRDPVDRMRLAWQLFPADVLFVHRDAEKEPLPVRQQEIDRWVAATFATVPPPYVRVVPVHMMESWLLTNEAALREAAGNPNGTMALGLPGIHKLEALPNPKQVLLEALKKATGNNPRRLRAFNERQAVHRLAEFNQESGFQALRALSSFSALEQEVVALISQIRPA